jgi:hypothetical protein
MSPVSRENFFNFSSSPMLRVGLCIGELIFADLSPTPAAAAVSNCWWRFANLFRFFVVFLLQYVDMSSRIIYCLVCWRGLDTF